jgi:hypothetical protein
VWIITMMKSLSSTISIPTSPSSPTIPAPIAI